MEKKKVAIIEDNYILSNSLSEAVVDAGFEVVRSFDGENGLSMVKKEKPDIILLDILLPKMNGIEMLRELRKDEWGKEAYVIVLSALNDNETVGDALEEDVFIYAVKDYYTLEDVIGLVKNKLESTD